MVAPVGKCEGGENISDLKIPVLRQSQYLDNPSTKPERFTMLKLMPVFFVVT